MVATADLLKFHRAPKGTSSYFFIEDGKRPKRNARVTLTMIGTIQEKLTVTDCPDCLAILLPEPFKDQLKRAEISVDQAWAFIEETLSTTPTVESPRMKALAKASRREAERLARIIAAVEGKEKTAEALGQELWALMAGHLEQAVKILDEWKSVYGYSKTGHIIVGNRNNRNAKKIAAGGSTIAA